MTACRKCGAPQADASGLCLSCRVGGLQSAISTEPVEAPLPPKSSKNLVLLAFAAACALGAAMLAPSAAREMREMKPLRAGTYETDQGTDWCIANLWKAAAKLQAGGTVVEYACPITHARYEVIVTSEDTVVRCPNPERHHLAELSSSALAPIPHAVP